MFYKQLVNGTLDMLNDKVNKGSFINVFCIISRQDDNVEFIAKNYLLFMFVNCIQIRDWLCMGNNSKNFCEMPLPCDHLSRQSNDGH